MQRHALELVFSQGTLKSLSGLSLFGVVVITRVSQWGLRHGVG